MSKIVIFNSFYYPNIIGGAEKSVQMIAESLAEEGNEVVIVCTSDVAQQAVLNNVKVYYVKIPNLYWAFYSKRNKAFSKFFWHVIDAWNIFSKKTLVKILRDEKPDVIHTNNLTGFSPYVFKIAKELQIPVVHTLRDYYLLCPRSTMFKHDKNCEEQCLSCQIFSWPKKRLSRHVDAVVGVSDFILMKHLSNGFFPNAKVRQRIFNIFKPSGESLGPPNGVGEIRFGFLGVLGRAKGIEYTIQSFEKVANPLARLQVFGRGETQQYEDYLMKSYSSERVKFYGFRDAKEIYSMIDVLIIPSMWNEPFPRTLIEAFSQGIPVLASKRGGITEMVVHGTNGFLFDPDDQNSLTDLIEAVLLNPSKLAMIRSNALASSMAFKKEVIIGQYKEVYSRSSQIQT